MFLLRIIEFGVGAIFLIYLLTQILIPLWQGTPLFPSLREKSSKLQKDLVDARGDVEDAKLGKEVAKTQAQAERYGKSNGSKPQKKAAKSR
ncbi:hypothetical protein M1432_00170 [Patescibacteria group bacterium]|nr:hypothetical protein [Patescibacteria group bacterium]